VSARIRAIPNYSYILQPIVYFTIKVKSREEGAICELFTFWNG